MSELFRTEYGAKWFREEGASINSIERRKLYGQIRDWERVAIVGITGWTAQRYASLRYNLEHHETDADRSKRNRVYPKERARRYAKRARART